MKKKLLVLLALVAVAATSCYGTTAVTFFGISNGSSALMTSYTSGQPLAYFLVGVDTSTNTNDPNSVWKFMDGSDYWDSCYNPNFPGGTANPGQGSVTSIFETVHFPAVPAGAFPRSVYNADGTVNHTTSTAGDSLSFKIVNYGPGAGFNTGQCDEAYGSINTTTALLPTVNIYPGESMTIYLQAMCGDLLGNERPCSVPNGTQVNAGAVANSQADGLGTTYATW